MPQRYIALTCGAMARSVYAAAATSDHVISVRLFSQGLHNTPRALRDRLQGEIDRIQSGECDAILLAYGMCGTSTLGLTAHHTPLVMARAHDCITLYLGSREHYQAEFDAFPGTYWYSQDYLERNESGSNAVLGAGSIGAMGELRAEYAEKYGQENADYLVEVMGEWGKHYNRAVYIDMGSANSHSYEDIAREQAERRGWLFERKEGNRRLIEMLVHGEWLHDEILVVPPGYSIEQAGPNKIVQAVPKQLAYRPAMR